MQYEVWEIGCNCDAKKDLFAIFFDERLAVRFAEYMAVQGYVVAVFEEKAK